MSRKELEQAVYRFEKEVLPQFIEEFAAKKNETSQYTLDDFLVFTSEIYSKIIRQLLEMLEEMDFSRLEAVVRLVFMGYIVSRLNNTLDSNHAFITAIAHNHEEDNYRFVVLYRESIRAFASYIPRNSIPILYCETERDLGAGRIEKLKIISSPGDFLEIWPLH